MEVLKLRRHLDRARSESDKVFRLIAPDAIYDRPVQERNRLIFYLGHFEAFDWNTLARKNLGEPSFHPEFDKLFERGIDPEPGKAAQDSPSDWPSREEVERYGETVRDWIDDHLNEFDPAVLQMAVEHRQMHAETLAYLMHCLPYERKAQGIALRASGRPTLANPMIPLCGGVVPMGQVAGEYGWDNERAPHEVTVMPFTISKFKISNGEYLEFVREGGPAPHFWCNENGSYYYHGMFETVPLPLDQPVWVTQSQAEAYAAWRGLALPTEPQFAHASGVAGALSEPDPVRDNFNFHRWDPIAVDAGHEHAANHAPVQMIGNGWEWTRDVFGPFEGFAADPYYPAYSADFFDGAHYVMKGASPRTATLLTRGGFRNWFRPDYPYMYAGFRVVGH